MRFTAIFPLLCAIAALVLSLLCMFAGSKPGFMEDAAIVTLNTSRLGYFTINQTKPSSTSPFAGVESLIASGLQKIGDDIASDIAQDLGIHDFYSAHVLTFCEGYYNPNGTAPNPSQNVTYCSKKSAGYWFNPTNVVSSELKHGVTLADVKWPSQIDDSLNYIRHGSKAYFVIYIIAIVLTGIFVITSLLGIFLGRGVALANFFLGFFAALALTIASGIATAVMVKVTNVVNGNGKDIGLAASRGGKFLAMTWAATGLLLLASVWWIGECIFGHRKTKTVRTTKVHY